MNTTETEEPKQPQAPQGDSDSTDRVQDTQSGVELSSLPNASPLRSVSPPSPNTQPSPFERPYDPPEIRTEDVDFGVHNGDGTPRGDDQFDPRDSITIKNDYEFLRGGYGSTFDSDTRSLLSAKHYDHHESRKFLFKTGAYRFLMTLGFSILIGLSLRAYEGFKKPFIMDKFQVRVFNALMLGLSLGLGLNLASSLKRYAVILRWYLLTRRYVSLEVFDLILGLETLTKVGKLMIISLPGIRRIKMLHKLPWFREARDDGTRFTWIACLLWILINIAAQVLVAALSLFWPVDPSETSTLLTYGNVAVANLNLWSLDVGDKSWWNNITSMEAAWTAGMESVMYKNFSIDDIQSDLSTMAGTPLYGGKADYEYKFYNRNPDHEFEDYALSTRSVKTTAVCQQLELAVNDPTYVDPDNFTDYYYIKAKEEGKDWDYYYLPDYTTGCMTWVGSTFQSCGPRCTNFTVFQHADHRAIKNSALWLCNSTVTNIAGDSSEFMNLSDEDKKALYGTDEFARIAAGAIAWTGYFPGDWTSRQVRSYLRGSKWSPNRMVSTDDVEDLLSRFTIGAIAAFDDHGHRYQLQNQHARPTQGQRLRVDWPYILGLLGGVCLIQLAALVCLLNFGNKSVIRDESFLSMAMLLRPVVDRIPGQMGMNLSGHEIKNHPRLLWKRIRYDYREGKNGEPNQVDIFFQGRDDAISRRSWAPGVYT